MFQNGNGTGTNRSSELIQNLYLLSRRPFYREISWKLESRDSGLNCSNRYDYYNTKTWGFEKFDCNTSYRFVSGGADKSGDHRRVRNQNTTKKP